MIRETYLAAVKDAVSPGDTVFDISRLEEEKGSVSPLAPSRELLEDWNSGRIVWKVYVERYYQELRESKAANSLIAEIAELAARKDVWLVGEEKEYPCHRFLVKQVIERILVARGFLSGLEDYSTHYDLFKNRTRPEILALTRRNSQGPAGTRRQKQALLPLLGRETDE
ncbi:MAG: DUF488 family protein [Deltaproteobacteria bacterium]|nr:DUF488 family protein [Deltaproteobacteria bacterium]